MAAIFPVYCLPLLAMKWGFRKPSLRKRIAARTSWKRYVRHSLGLKAPRGWGWLTNPRKAAYNRLYRRTTFGLDDVFKTRRRRSPQAGCVVLLTALSVALLALGVSAVAANRSQWVVHGRANTHSSQARE